MKNRTNNWSIDSKHLCTALSAEAGQMKSWSNRGQESGGLGAATRSYHDVYGVSYRTSIAHGLRHTDTWPSADKNGRAPAQPWPDPRKPPTWSRDRGHGLGHRKRWSTCAPPSMLPRAQ